ncbi:hypothetical protein PV326_009872 [Microctonus aethiopoides]|nr:hypothetical protein PV326_009872 [Microctonus aethiopoides]
MLFAKLATNDIEIHINIAGLMIEFEEDVFPYKFSESGLHTLQNIPNLDAFQTIHESLPNYIRRHKAIFLRDAFDFIFISTHYPIEYDGKPIKGYSRKPFSIYNQRKSRKFYHTALGLVVQQKDAFGDYVIATGLIANLMDIKYDQPSEDLLYNREECVGIMHSSSNHCRRCLVWSKENQKQLKEYARSNTNRCFLLNYPRSLYPHDSRVRSMNPENQCSCYGFDIKDMDRTYLISIPIDKCAVGLQCSRPGEDVSSILPLDGTPCGNVNAVCWNMKCVTINEGIDVDDCKESCTPPKRQKTTHEDIRNKKEFENY